MPLPLTLALIGVVIAALVLRLVVPGLPLRRWARPVRPVDATLAGLGALGLVGHCTAMFYPRLVAALPGTDRYLAAVNGMGAASVAWYLGPALLVLVGLRRPRPVAVGLLAVSLLAVGITMYDGGPLNVHLSAITLAVVMLAASGALLVRPARRQAGTTDR